MLWALAKCFTWYGWHKQNDDKKIPEMGNNEPWLYCPSSSHSALCTGHTNVSIPNVPLDVRNVNTECNAQDTRHGKSRSLPLLSSISPSLECSDWASGGVWSTATLFWFIIFSLSFGFVRFLLGTVTVRLCNWDMPDSVKQTPSCVYVFGGSIKVKWIITAI